MELQWEFSIVSLEFSDMPRTGLRKITTGRHMIFYMAEENEVQIVRIMEQQ